MLDFDTCRRLAKAGFPQIGPSFYYKDESDRLRVRGVRVEGDICRPAIEDLLRELGEDFRQLAYLQGGYSDPAKRWFAYGRDDHSTIGATPEQALSSLYLALHE